MSKGSENNRGGSSSSLPPPKPERRTGIRARVALPVAFRFESVLDFVDTQSMNISETGMFIETDAPAPLGSKIEFNFALQDGFTLLHGTAEVTRMIRTGPVNGMGVRFLDLDDANRTLIARIVEVNSREGRNSTLNFDFSRPATAAAMPVVTDAPPEPLGPVAASSSVQPTLPASAPLPTPPIHFEGRSLRLVLGPSTAPHFTQNPLLNVRSGGFFIPAPEDVPLGTVFQVEIVDAVGRTVVAGKGKVVAKQDVRVGIRLADVDKEALARLRAEVDKFGASK